MPTTVTIIFREYGGVVSDGSSGCGGVDRKITVVDSLGDVNTVYSTLATFIEPYRLMDCQEFDQRISWNSPTFTEVIADSNRVIYRVSSIHFDGGISLDVVQGVSLSSAVVPMELDGGVDVPTLSLYSGLYQGGWFATIQIDSFDTSLISADFQENPDRYAFGYYAVMHHGHVAERCQLDSRNIYVPLHVWFPTLEPNGEVQDVNVWVPVPTWERGTGIRWYLNYSVKGTCKLWWMKLLSGIDAHF